MIPRIIFDDLSDSESLNTSTSQSEPPRASSGPAGLQAINDRDFETLIDLLGTSGNDSGKFMRRSVLNGNTTTQPRLLSQSKTEQPTDAASLNMRSPEKPREELSDDEEQSSNELDAPKSPVLIGARAASVGISHLRLQSPDRSSRSNRAQPIGDMSFASPSRQVRRQQEDQAENGHSGSIGNSQSTASPSPARPPGATLIKSKATLPSASTSFTGLTRELNASINEAQRQVIDLRSRIEQLKDGVKEVSPHLYRRAFEQAPHPSKVRGRDASLEGHSSTDPAVVEPHSGRNGSMEYSEERIEDVVSQLNDDDARKALNNVCCALRIEPRVLLSPSPDMLEHDSPRSLTDVTRALHVVSDLDGLVWRRANRRSTKPKVRFDEDTSNVYSQDNLDALMGRVRLWERISRAHSDRPSGT